MARTGIASFWWVFGDDMYFDNGRVYVVGQDAPLNVWCGVEGRRVPILAPEPKVQERLYRRLADMFYPLPAGLARFLVSPDIAHRLVPPDRPSPSAMGIILTCDPTLPPNSVARPEVLQKGG
jgi:hypothetical protein